MLTQMNTRRRFKPKRRNINNPSTNRAILVTEEEAQEEIIYVCIFICIKIHRFL